jgi:hypothetical protein
MEMWQWVMLFSAVAINTAANVFRLYLEFKNGKKL